MSEEDKINEELKELILARIDIMPPNFKLSIGKQGTLSKQEMIENVKKESEVGRQIIDMEINFIKALTSGKLIDTINKNE